MTHAWITGGTGLIGRWLVPALTRRGATVTAIVRNAAERRREYLEWVAAHDGRAEAVTLVEGDLAAPGLGLSESDRARARDATEVFHAGALMQWGMEADFARRANVDGTAALVELALGAKSLRRFVAIGGFKMADDASFRHAGIDPEGDYQREVYTPQYARLGAYEASKLEADHLVRDAARRRGLPLTRIHPGGVMGDSRTGETTQFVGFSPLVEALWYGKLPAVPGGARTWLPLVTVDFLAELIARVSELPGTLGGSYTVLDDRTPMLVDVVAAIADRIGVKAPRRRVPIGLLRALLRAHLVPGATATPEELTFLSDQRHDVQNTLAVAAQLGLTWPDVGAAIERCVDFLVATRFGKRAPIAGAQLDRIGGSRTFTSGDRTTPDYVLLHGLPLDSDSWDALAAQLPGSALRADLPGIGRSAAPAATPLEWMSSLLGPTKRPSWIVSHSLGTMYALELAAAHPERVAGLVLISPFFLQKPPPAPMRLRRLARVLGRLLRRKHLEQLVAGDARATTPVLDGPAAHLRRPGARAQFGDALARAHAQRAALADKLAIAAARMPVLIIYGEHDPLVTSTGGVRALELPGTGHYPQLDQPARVAAAIRELVEATGTMAA